MNEQQKQMLEEALECVEEVCEELRYMKRTERIKRLRNYLDKASTRIYHALKPEAVLISDIQNKKE